MPNARSLAASAGGRTWLAGQKKRRIAAAGVAIAAALAGSPMAGVPQASASTGETVIVTATGLLSPAAAVLGAGGTLLTQFHLIDGVEAVISPALEPVLAALPGITVTPDVSVNVQDTPESTGPHAPSDVFLGQTGATRLAAAGDAGQGVTVAVLDTGIDNLPDFSGRLIGGVDLTGGNNPFQDSYGHGTFVAGHLHGHQPARPGGASGMGLGYRGSCRHGQRRAIQRHHPLPGG
jgi:subtilisin family serine protease